MPRLQRNISWLASYRMGKGIRARDIALAKKIAPATCTRLERGDSVGKIVAAKYFHCLDIDLNNRATWPEGLKIIDEGQAIRIALNHDS